MKSIYNPYTEKLVSSYLRNLYYPNVAYLHYIIKKTPYIHMYICDLKMGRNKGKNISTKYSFFIWRIQYIYYTMLHFTFITSSQKQSYFQYTASSNVET